MHEQDRTLVVRLLEKRLGELPEGYKTKEEAQHSFPEPPIWAVVANIVQEHEFGEDHETRRGTKNFGSGAKVCIVILQHERDRVEVVGHSRVGKEMKNRASKPKN